MTDLLYTESLSYNRRPLVNYRECNEVLPLGLSVTPLIRKERVQNPPQFDGTFATPGIREVWLRKLGESTWLEKTFSNAAGYFVFKGIYYELHQYEYGVVDNDGTISQIFKIDFPAYSRYLGNPDVNDSSGYTRV